MRKDLIVFSKMYLGSWLVAMAARSLVRSSSICTMLMAGSFL